jgi:hypothetical protein
VIKVDLGRFHDPFARSACGVARRIEADRLERARVIARAPVELDRRHGLVKLRAWGDVRGRDA